MGSPASASEVCQSMGLDVHVSGLNQSTHDQRMPEEILTPQAERFRMKLIKDFRLLENLNEMEQGVESPKYFPSDIVNRASY